MRKFLKPLLSVALVSVLALNVSFMFAGTANATTQADNYQKMDSVLQAKLQEMGENEEICVSVWVKDIDRKVLQRNVQAALQEDIDKGEVSQSLVDNVLDVEQTDCNSDFSVSQLSDINSSDVTTQEAYYVLHTERAEARQLHEVNNAGIYNELFPNEDSQPEIVYMCKYAPDMELMLTKAEILDIISSDKVDSLYYVDTEAVLTNDEDLDAVSDSVSTTSTGTYDTTYFNVTGLAQSRDVWHLNGTGINVGIIEADDNVNPSEFPNSSVTVVYGDNSSATSTHASDVACIMIGKFDNYTGAIPNANLYSAKAHYPQYTAFAIDALLEKDVSVINCSFSTGPAIHNAYGDIAKLYDYISFNHKVCFVLSSSNNGSTGLWSSNMAYNAIVVGNCNTSGVLSSDSSYYSGDALAYKPDIVAPAKIVDLPVQNGPINGGTSCATPMVTSAVAQLQQAKPALLTLKPNLVKALLLSSSKITDGMSDDFSLSTTTDDSISWSKKYGAGMLYTVNAYTSLVDYEYYQTSTTSSNSIGFSFSKHVSVRGEKTMRVCLTWDKVLEELEDGTLQEYDLDNFKLVVTTPSGLTYTSKCLNDNKQMVSFKTSEIGTYEISGVRVGDSNSGHFVNYAIALTLQ